MQMEMSIATINLLMDEIVIIRRIRNSLSCNHYCCPKWAPPGAFFSHELYDLFYCIMLQLRQYDDMTLVMGKLHFLKVSICRRRYQTF